MSVNSCNRVIVKRETKSIEEIENSIIKKYRSKLWSQFLKGNKEFELIEPGDTVAVCISGGKDSLLMAKLFQEYQRHIDPTINLVYIAMNPGFTDANKELLQDTCNRMGIPVDIYDTEIFKIVQKIANDYPCYMCSRMRRGALYSYAQEKGCNKIALGHHFDDFIETILLNVFYAGKYETMMPKLKAQNYEGIELIRPMLFIRENDIIRFNEHNLINNMDCGCVVAAKQTSSKRREIKEMIKEMKKTNKEVEKSIFSSAMNVNLDMILGYKEHGRKHSFLDNYDQKENLGKEKKKQKVNKEIKDDIKNKSTINEESKEA